MAFAVALSGLATEGIPRASATTESATERVLVRLDGGPALQSVDPARIDTRGEVSASAVREVRERRAELRTAQTRFLTAVRDAGIEATPRARLTGLVNGVALTVSPADRSRLADLPGVSAVLDDTRMRASTDTSVDLIGASKVWQRKDPSGTGARGAGTTIAVIDTGVDYSHPDLGGGFGPDHKVVGGHDFVNDDDDPTDDNGHGTHVAGIIAADGQRPDGVLGVAPDAQLTAYKVLDADGSGYTSDIIAGLEAAVDPGNPHRADVVNMSLGGPGDGTDPLGRAATAASKLGVVVVAAAGNSGPGAGTVGTPAVADGVLSVGASTSGLTLPTAHMVTPRRELLQTYRAPYSANPPQKPVTGELVDVGDGTAQDYDRAGDVTGKVVAYRALLPQSMRDVRLQLLEQARLAEERGAIALLGYTASSGGPVLAPQRAEAGTGDLDTPGTVRVDLGARQSGDSFRMDKIVVLGLAETQWPELSAALAKGKVEISLSGQDVTDQIASFSSRGPGPHFQLEPDLVAPGVDIRSTWPKEQWEPGSYRLSGTSMAAPHAAASAALLRQLDPSASAEEIRARLIGSATSVEGAPTTAQGAGRLDVADAADATVTASPTSLSLGLADLSRDRVSRSGEVALHNSSDRSTTLRLSTRTAGKDAGDAGVSPARVTIPAGGTRSVTVRVSGDVGTSADRDLAGWLVAAPERAGEPSLRVPYLLAVRPLVVQTSPDPSDGDSTAFIFSRTPLAGPPTVTVTPPQGRPVESVAKRDHGNWYRARLDGDRAGTYTVSVRAEAESGERLRGGSAFEALPEDNRPGGRRWEPIGPNGAAGTIATTEADPSTAVLTQYVNRGPWKTDDAGATWRQLSRLPVANGTGSALVDARDPDTLWYAVNAQTGGGGAVNSVLDYTYQGQLLRSRDGGRTWQRLDVPDTHLYALVRDPGSRVLALVTADAVLLSHDGGDTWTERPNPLGTAVLDAAIGGDSLYLGGSTSVWKLPGVLDDREAPAAERVYDAPDGERLRHLTADADLVAAITYDKVVGSRDGGGHWEDLHRAESGGFQSITLRKGTLAVFTVGAQQHLSRDHGKSWTVVNKPITGSVMSDLSPWTDDSLLWSAPGAGMFTTGKDGSDPRRVGVQGVNAYDLAVLDTDQPQLLAGTDSEIYRTALPTGPVTPKTAEWGLSGSEAYFGRKIGQIGVSPKDPDTVWKIRKDALSSFYVYRSGDAGKTWKERARTNETPLNMAVGPVDDDRVAVTFWSLAGPGVYRTLDGGETWKKLYHDRIFRAIATDPRDPDRLWLGAADGLYRSDDFGATVTKVADGAVSAITLSKDGKRLVIGGSTLRVSDDGGAHFRTTDTGPLPLQVSEIVLSPKDPDTIYAGTSSFTANDLVKGGRGVLRSTNGGRTWTNVSGGLQNLDVISMTTSPDGDWLYAGTRMGGVHRLRTG
ncbi:S8 family serine peptidase [Streptomyces colonosanans]|uniref:S8 family serine peptidase n=1 Tax=Streptomyces colonosanans TaxID=1428652 RepID=UPI000A70A9DE|nr:S8 family serine peptidase [Streptomyces colonosanans]